MSVPTLMMIGADGSEYYNDEISAVPAVLRGCEIQMMQLNCFDEGMH